MLKTSCNLYFLIFYTSYIVAQGNEFNHYNLENGLPSNRIYSSYEDHAGFMWFATDNGVSYFDGYEFYNYTTKNGLSDNEIFFMFEDSQNRIWFASFNGKLSYYHKGVVFNSSTDTSLLKLEHPSRITCINELKNGSVIISYYHHGIFEYKKNKEVNHLTKDHPLKTTRSFYVNQNGELVQIGNNQIVIYSKDSVFEKSYPAWLFERNFILDNTHHFSKGPGLYKFDYNDYSFKKVVDMGGIILQANKVEDSYWINLENGGTVKWAPNKKVCQKVLENYKISKVYQDHQKNLWITTLNDGILHRPPIQTTNYSKENGLKYNEVLCLASDNNNIWFGHDLMALSKLKDQTFQTFDFSHLVKGNKTNISLRSLLAFDDKLFAICERNLLYKTSGKSILLPIGGKDIIFNSDSQMVVANGVGGLSALKTNFIDTLLSLDKDYSEAEIRNLFRSFSKFYYDSRTTTLHKQKNGNDIWVGLTNGILKQKNDSLIRIDDKYPELKQRITDITSNSSGVIFIATYNNSLFTIFNDTIQHLEFTNDLFSNQCNAIELENDSILWVGSNKGVCRLIFDSKYLHKSMSYINTTHGLPSDKINDILIHRDQIWVATPKGASSFSTDIDKFNSSIPKVYIMGILANDRPISLHNSIELPHLENIIKINYVCLSYSSMKNIQYKYRLNTTSKNKKEWVLTKSRSLEFSSLAPGNYLFEVAAQNSSGFWGKPKQINLTIKPPFWKTTWFISVEVMAFLIILSGVIALVIKWHAKREAQKRHSLNTEIKSLRAQMNFHFLSNAFSSIQGIFLNNETLYNHFEMLSQIMRYNLEHSEEDLMSLSEELNYLKSYTALEQLKTHYTIKLIISVEKKLDPDKIYVPATFLQPFIENSIIHGILPTKRNGTIKLTVGSLINGSYFIVIEDDGIGYEASIQQKKFKKRKSYGMDLVKNRFDALFDKDNTLDITIEDLAYTGKSGTRMTLRLPDLSNERNKNSDHRG